MMLVAAGGVVAVLFLGAWSPQTVWCGTRGAGECRYEHESQILNFPGSPPGGCWTNQREVCDETDP
jgi:hypothetical protein